MIRPDSLIGSILRTSIQAKAKPRVNPGTPHLKPREIVEGKVLKALSKDTALLLIKGREVRAKTHFPLRAGSTLRLMTEEVSPMPSFKPLGTASFGAGPINAHLILSALKGNLWKSIYDHVRQSTLPEKHKSRLLKLIEKVTLHPLSKITPELIRQLIDRSGLGWEGKLGRAIARGAASKTDVDSLLRDDLKGSAGKLSSLEGPGGPFDRLTSVIKGIQVLNLIGLDQEKQVFLPIPVLSSDGSSSIIEILIRLPWNGSREEKEEENDDTPSETGTMTVSMQMTLTRLGPIRTDLILQGETVEGQFLLQTPEAKSLMDEGLPSFVDRLVDVGFTVTRMSCRISERMAIDGSLITEMIQEEDGAFSLVI